MEGEPKTPFLNCLKINDLIKHYILEYLRTCVGIKRRREGGKG